VTTDTVVSSGGEVVVSSGGTASRVVVSSGGFEIALAGGGTSRTTILSGGRELISSGGIDRGAHVDSGGLEVVSSGGAAVAATISGGRLEVARGGSTGNAAITFATSAGGVLQLDSSLTFKGGLIAGFGKPDKLDLRDIAFTSGVTHATWTQSGTTSGTLAVTSGSETATITLLGQYVAGNFHVSSDKHGGTFVTDPPVGAWQNVALVNPHQT
jgi:autotransporter passenger strand-loop-strand repeat protein